MWERRLKQIRRVLAKEYRVADCRVRHHCGVEKRDGYLVRLDELEHAREQQRLELEAALMIRIRQNVEDVLHNAQEVLLEERICNRWIGTREVVDDFQAHYCRHASELVRHNFQA